MQCRRPTVILHTRIRISHVTHVPIRTAYSVHRQTQTKFLAKYVIKINEFDSKTKWAECIVHVHCVAFKISDNIYYVRIYTESGARKFRLHFCSMLEHKNNHQMDEYCISCSFVFCLLANFQRLHRSVCRDPLCVYVVYLERMTRDERLTTIADGTSIEDSLFDVALHLSNDDFHTYFSHFFDDFRDFSFDMFNW